MINTRKILNISTYDLAGFNASTPVFHTVLPTVKPKRITKDRIKVKYSKFLLRGSPPPRPLHHHRRHETLPSSVIRTPRRT